MTSNPVPKPMNAFLIVNGADIVPLEKPLINIGRMDDNDIVLANAHVSRYHAQLRAADGKYLLVDLQSTSGTSVNGNRITQKILAPGDVISMAGIPIIYGETSGPEKLNDRNLPDSGLHGPQRPGLDATDSLDLAPLDQFLEMFDNPEEGQSEL